MLALKVKPNPPALARQFKLLYFRSERRSLYFEDGFSSNSEKLKRTFV